MLKTERKIFLNKHHVSTTSITKAHRSMKYPISPFCKTRCYFTLARKETHRCPWNNLEHTHWIIIWSQIALRTNKQTRNCQPHPTGHVVRILSLWKHPKYRRLNPRNSISQNSRTCPQLVYKHRIPSTQLSNGTFHCLGKDPKLHRSRKPYTNWNNLPHTRNSTCFVLQS